MSYGANENTLEAARARLETALSSLTQGMASTKNALDIAKAAAGENTTMADRIASLEQENLKLHEQVAALALQPAANDVDKGLESLREEKATLARDYQLLKSQHADLKNQLSNDNTGSEADLDLQKIIDGLTHKNAMMEQEKSSLKKELDKTIADLEALMESA